MRIFLLILIAAITFGGYTAAAHAVADESCNPVTLDHQAHSHDNDCSDHAAEKQHDDKQSSKSMCLDCHHCCASHAVNMTDDAKQVLPQIVTFVPLATKQFTGDYRFPLLRPPKHLV